MTATIRRTQDELVAELKARFGTDHKRWAFICPACKDVATAQDFKVALDRADRDENPFRHLGQICIGRLLGALDREQPKGGYAGRGCDWAAFGLFRGPEFVILPDGREMPSFAIAPAPVKLRLRDLDNRGDDQEPFEFTDFAEKVVGYLDGPLRRDLADGSGAHADVDEAIAAIRNGDLETANQILNPMSIQLTALADAEALTESETAS